MRSKVVSAGKEVIKQVCATLCVAMVPSPITRCRCQGDRGDMFYVIERGAFDVLVDGEVVSTLEAGANFGELALLYNCPRFVIPTVHILLACHLSHGDCDPALQRCNCACCNCGYPMGLGSHYLPSHHPSSHQPGAGRQPTMAAQVRAYGNRRSQLHHQGRLSSACCACVQGIAA